jgi:hypothetical protein
VQVVREAVHEDDRRFVARMLACVDAVLTASDVRFLEGHLRCPKGTFSS